MVFRFKWSSEYQVSSFFVLTFNKYLITTGKIYYRPGYRQYNLTVRKGNAQDNTTPVKWHHRKKLAIHVDVFVSVAVRGA